METLTIKIIIETINEDNVKERKESNKDVDNVKEEEKERKYDRNNEKECDRNTAKTPTTINTFKLTIPPHTNINTVHNFLLSLINTFIGDNNLDGSQDFIDDSDNPFINDDDINQYIDNEE